MKHVFRFLLVVILLAAVAGGGYWVYQNRIATKATPASGGFTQVMPVRQGNLNTNVSVVGQLEAVQSAELAFDRISGATKLLSLAVKPGNTVTATQVVATIDPAPYQQALDQAKSDLQAAEKTLADLKTPPTDLQIAQADLAIAKAEVQLQQAKSDLANPDSLDLVSLRNTVQDEKDNLDLIQFQATLAEHAAIAKTERDLHYNVQWWQRRVEQLLELEREHEANLEQMQERQKGQALLSGLEPDLARIRAQRELARQATAAEIAKGKVTLADAQAALAKAQAGGDKLALAQAQVAVQEAQVALLAAQDARTKLTAGADASALATAQADLDKKRLALSDAQADLAATILAAPFDGTVLETHATPGTQITAATAILSLANLKALQVVAAIDETTIRRIAADQDVQITFDAFPGQRFRGKVLAIPLQGALQGGVMVYDVPISLTGADKLPLLVGMTANAQIQVAQAANALLVPTMALQRVGGQYQVLLPVTDPALPEGATVAVPVEVGLSDGVNTQITSGLQPGDQVVVQVEAAQTTSPFAPPGNPGAPGGQNSPQNDNRQQQNRSAGAGGR
jgi:RND family efflux transporter MFP subunit